MFCTNCGKEVAQGAHFCEYCGTELIAASAQTGSEQQATQAAPTPVPPAPSAPVPPASPVAPVQPAAPTAPTQPSPQAQQIPAQENVAQPVQPEAPQGNYQQYQTPVPPAPPAQAYDPSGQIYEVSSQDKTLRLINFIFCIISAAASCWLILPLAWMIPMTVHSWSIYKGKKPNTVAFGVCTLIFVSIVGGILLLVSKKDNE